MRENLDASSEIESEIVGWEKYKLFSNQKNLTQLPTLPTYVVADADADAVVVAVGATAPAAFIAWK